MCNTHLVKSMKEAYSSGFTVHSLPHMLSLSTTLAIFIMLGLSSLAVFWAKRVRLPHTVFLVLLGMVLGAASILPPLAFIQSFTLTPELLFYLLLPTLIFESAYHMSARRLVADSGIISLLAIVSFSLSTVLIGGGLYLLFGWLTLDIPFLFTLLFGALISATDPVAVLALFKEYGAPCRLSLIFEGESLFNDATAVAAFLVLLEIVLRTSGETSLFEGALSVVSMLLGGIVFGLIMGGGFAYMVGKTREHETASITLTIVLAHLTFILAELVSEHLIIGSLALPISPIISTTIASLVMGNYGRAKLHHRAETAVKNIWEQLAFLSNSLIFILIGILVVQTSYSVALGGITILTIVVVALARALSIYPVVQLYNLTSSAEQNIPASWQHMLSWGSLRGALAVTMVLLVPDTLTFPGWTFMHSPKEVLLALTIGCIVATLFIKATTIRSMMRALSLDTLTTTEELEYQEARALMHHAVTEKLTQYHERGYIDTAIAEQLLDEHAEAFTQACKTISALSIERRSDLAHRVLRMYAIGIEKRHLKELYHHQEVNETVYRQLSGKLQLQLESIESGNLSPNMSLHSDGRDILERLFSAIELILQPATPLDHFRNKYQYYRAQAIISRKVVKEFDTMSGTSASTIFTTDAVKHVRDLYTTFKTQSLGKLTSLADTNPTEAAKLAYTLAEHAVHTIEHAILEKINHQQLITPKLFVTLHEEVSTNHSERAK